VLNSSQKTLNAEPLVSVGIPTFNRSDGLRRTLECITEQTFQNLEIIVSDNCSPGPETEAVVREFIVKDRRIQYYQQEENRGPGFNFGFVLEKATGKYFLWAADDDVHEREFISCLVDPLENCPEVLGAMCSTKRVDESGKFIDIVRFSDVSNPLSAPSRLELTFFFHGIFRTKGLRKFMGDGNEQFGIDLMKVCEMILASKLVWIDHVLFTKGFDRPRNSRIFSLDPLCWFKMAYNFPIYLLKSKNITTRKKILVIPMSLIFLLWVIKLYAGHLIYLVTGNPKF
jgi:glycosyltransferase involved in cell wall biosynthesis